MTVGYKNTAEIDEAIENLNLALASAGGGGDDGLRSRLFLPGGWL